LAAITLLVIGGPLRSPASTAGRAIVSPFVTVVRGVTKPVGETVASWFDYAEVVGQNQRLSAELGNVRLQQEELGFEQRQLQDLLALQHLPFLGTLPTEMAAATNENVSNFAATIEIDKGTSGGVLVGMPVVGAGGLVGRVTSVTPDGATVTLLTDATQSVAVTFGAGYDANVHGQGAGIDLGSQGVAPGTPVHLGEMLYTDGFQGGLYPAGIPVGTVAAARTSRAATQISLSVAPLADLDSLAYVDVVLWEGGS
jgi:rod shape-determining protein MreC